MSVFCIWNKYINLIREKKKPSKTIYGVEIHFSSWEEAHEFIVAERKKSVQDAEKNLKRAKASLQNALAMHRRASPTGETESAKEKPSSV